MTTKFKMRVYILLAVIMTGCRSLPDQITPTRNELITPSLELSSATITTSVTPQFTPIQPSVTPMPSPSSTIKPSLTQTTEPNEQVIPVCTGNGQILSPRSDIGIKGTIAYQKGNYQGLYTIGGTPLLQGTIDSEQKVVVFGFSPDGNWLAYAPEESSSGETVVFGTPMMILLSAAGERIEQNMNVSGLEKELQDRCCCCQGYKFFDSAGEWINNSLMYIHLGATSDIEGGMFSSLPKIFNSMTGIWEDNWLSSLPDLYTIMPTRGGIHHIKISPDLSRILYPAESGGIILRDLIHDTEIWSDKEFAVPWGEEIAWSSNSATVAAVNILYVGPGNRRLLLISRDGEVTEIVNDAYPQPELEPVSLSWSPDSRYLAFFDRHSNVNLYLYDTQSDRYIYHCPLTGITYGYPSLVWSPDSEWIAFSDMPEGSMQLLNVQSGEAIELLENAIPLGWSEDFPVEWP